MLATSFFIVVALRAHVTIVFAGVNIPEHRRPAPYADIPFAAQPRTLKFLEGDAIIERGRAVRIQLFGSSKTFFGRLPRVSRPRGE